MLVFVEIVVSITQDGKTDKIRGTKDVLLVCKGKCNVTSTVLGTAHSLDKVKLFDLEDRAFVCFHYR